MSGVLVPGSRILDYGFSGKDGGFRCLVYFRVACVTQVYNLTSLQGFA